MNLQADQHGFLIPTRTLASIEEALNGIDTHLGNIVRLLQGQALARTDFMQRTVQQRTVQQVMRAQNLQELQAPTLQQITRQAAANNPRLPSENPPSQIQINRQTNRQADASNVRTLNQAEPQTTRRQPAARRSRSRTAQAELTPANNSTDTAAQTRDRRGRFRAQGDAEGENAQAPSEQAMQEKLDNALARLADLPALSGDANQLDPTLDAILEMKGVLEGPIKLLGSAGSAMLGMGAKSEQDARAQVATPWHKRMLKAIGLSRTEASAFQRAMLRRRDRPSVIGASNAPVAETGIIMSAIKMLFSPIGALAVSALATWMYTARDKLSDAMLMGMQAMTHTWENAVKGFAASWENIAQWAKTKLDALADFGIGMKDKLGNAVQITKQVVAPLAQKAVEPIAQTANAANTALKTATGVDVKAGAQTLAMNASKASKTGIAGINQAATRAQAVGGSLLEKVLPQGYRHKAMFDGIAGGAGLTKNGSYTDAEAQQIRSLKNSGANTSANLKGGMPVEVQQKIIQQAQAAGLQPEMMLQIAAMESGGNVHAISSTGAIGIYQFTGKTATGVGIKNRFDLDENIAGGMKLTQQNKQALQAAKLPVSAENLYMMHQLGPTAAQEIIRGAQQGKTISSLSPDTQKAVSLNYGAQAKTAKEYLAKNQAALANRANEVVGKSQVGFLPTGSAVSVTNTQPSLVKSAMPATAQAISAVAPTGMLVAAPAIAAATQIKTVAAAKPPTPVAPPPAPQLETATRLNSPAPLEVIVRNEQAVAQDVADRRLAAIASGGVSKL